ncbi:MAG: hypothetical protein FJ045_00725 [Crenarchaeota archaeon]|nr:hypothetical protein [Thermoproteota archaeon]
MVPMERRSKFADTDLTRIDFGKLPGRFEFVPKTFVVYNDRIALFISERKGFGASLYLPESLRFKAGLCFVRGDVQSNLMEAFKRIREMLRRRNSAAPDVQTIFDKSLLSVSEVNETTPISQNTIVHDGQIAIKIYPIGVQSIFVLDGFETAYGSVPIGCVVEKKEWGAVFNNIAAAWERLSKSFDARSGFPGTPNVN